MSGLFNGEDVNALSKLSPNVIVVLSLNVSFKTNIQFPYPSSEVYSFKSISPLLFLCLREPYIGRFFISSRYEIFCPISSTFALMDGEYVPDEVLTSKLHITLQKNDSKVVKEISLLDLLNNSTSILIK